MKGNRMYFKKSGLNIHLILFIFITSQDEFKYRRTQKCEDDDYRTVYKGGSNLEEEYRDGS